MKKTFGFTTALLSTFTLLLTACSGESNTTTNPSNNAQNSTNTTTVATTNSIPIGVAVAQTSNVALLGQEQVAGAKIAEKYFNDKGGVNGTPIKLIFQDTAGDEAGTINAFQTLINKDKVVGLKFQL
jgi:branched-chain amino acid transport system substrate-binding protein